MGVGVIPWVGHRDLQLLLDIRKIQAPGFPSVEDFGYVCGPVPPYWVSKSQRKHSKFVEQNLMWFKSLQK